MALRLERRTRWRRLRRWRTTPPTLIDEIGVIGTADEVHDRIRSDAEGGVHTSIIATPLAASQDEADRTFAAFTADQFSF